MALEDGPEQLPELRLERVEGKDVLLEVGRRKSLGMSLLELHA